MYVCEMVWTPQRARQVREAVERESGRPCPCTVGKPCPFVKLEGFAPQAESVGSGASDA